MSGRDNNDANECANAWARLQFVCGALDLSERLNGRVPIDLNQALGWAHLNSATTASLSSLSPLSAEDKNSPTRSIEGDTSVGLSGERCYELLARALLANSGSNDPPLAVQPNYWTIWAFVNGTYANLQCLSDTRGVLSSALLPDYNEG